MVAEYIDRDELIKKLNAGPYTVYDVCSQILEMPTVEVPHWIPVTEQLPGEEDGFVLVCVNGKPTGFITLEHAVELAEYDPADGWILEQYPDWTSPGVTHWMPVPEPPEEMSPNQDGASPELERMDCPVCGLETMVGTRASNGHFHGRCEACGAKMHE